MCEQHGGAFLYSGSDPFVLSSGGDPAPDMPFGFVDLHDLFDLEIEGPVKGGKPLGQVFMHGGFADAELFGGSTYRSPVLDHVKSQITGSFFPVGPQVLPLPRRVLLYLMRRWSRV